jgi:glycosyltransferase involved in cell wall biosynthesis
VIHSHVHSASGLLLLLAACENVSVRIAHFESSSDGRQATWRRRMQRRVMYQLIDKYATNILAVSRSVREAVTASASSTSWGRRWEHERRCEVLYYGVDLSLFPSACPAAMIRREFELSSSCRVYVHVGSIRTPKNHFRLLSIFAAVARRDPAAVLLLVGRGEAADLDRLRQHASNLRIADRIRFLGERQDIPRLLSGADMMIFPSLWEGLPGAVLEACAAGTPVLASSIPVMYEIADLLPLVRCLCLSRSDEQWALAAEELGNQADQPGARNLARQAFSRSPFNLKACVTAHSRIWNADAVPPNLHCSPHAA